MSYAMNGLLEGFPASAVASPSQLIAFSTPWGGTAVEGAYFATPYLVCQDKTAPCLYAPARKECDGTRNGEWSGFFVDYPEGLYIRPAFGNGSNYAFADGSARFRPMGANAGGKTDYRIDPYNLYDPQGHATWAWYEENGCHALLFRPDFDFQDFGRPLGGE